MSLSRAFGLALTMLLSSAGCGDDFVDDDLGPVPEKEIPVERRGLIPLKQGYLGGKRVDYYVLGTFVPADNAWFPRYDKFPGMPTRELYVFADAAGKLSLDSPQRPIVDHLPFQASASDFLELVVVRAPAGYRANDIKSRATLLRAGYPLERTGLVVNCPVVGASGRLASQGPTRALTLWYRKQAAWCVLLDGGVALFAEGMASPRKFITPISPERAEVRVSAAEMYALRANVFTGADLAPNIPIPKNNIFRYAPGDPEYSPLAKIWDVTRPSDYVVGSVTSYNALFPVPDFTGPDITVRSPEAFCNCPIVAVK